MVPLGEQMMEASVRKFFERYESSFNQSLGGDMDMDEEIGRASCRERV